MNKDSRVALISLSVVCFILLYSTVAFYVMEEGEKGKKIVLQKKLGDMTAEKQELEMKLKEVETLSVELKARLKTQEDTIADMTKSLGDEKDANTANLLKLKSHEDGIKAMEARLESEIAEKENLVKRITKLTEDYQSIRSQSENENKTKEETDKKAKETMEKEGVSLGTIVVDRKTQ